MVCYGPFLGRGYYLAAALQTADDTVYGIEEVLTVYGLLILAGGYQGRFIADIGNVGSGESWSLLCQELHVEVFGQLDLAQVYLEYLKTFVLFRQVYMYLPVETAGTH